jgi:hypothetical protein
MGSKARNPLRNGFLLVEDSDSRVGWVGGGSYAGDGGGGGGAGSMQAVD